MKNLTLVAHYGYKTNRFLSFVKTIWEKVETGMMKKAFERYKPEQLHFTIIGLEKLLGFESNYNLNTYQQKEVRIEMKVNDLYEKLASSFPIKVQIGGFDPNKYSFKSFGKNLYERSFGIRGDSVNLIGWSVKEDFRENKQLLNLRNSLNEENHIRHAYLEQEDNDFYMVLGKLSKKKLLSPIDLFHLQQEIPEKEQQNKRLSGTIVPTI